MGKLRYRVGRTCPRSVVVVELGLYPERQPCDSERICFKELTNTRQVGQLVALHILGIHAVKQEGAIQVLNKRPLWIQIARHGDPEPGFCEG